MGLSASRGVCLAMVGLLTGCAEPLETPAPLPVQVLHREGRHASPTVRSFVDLAIERLRANPALN